MKKKILFIILPLFMLLLPFNTKAITKTNFNETSNGVINTTIHFDEGFVGGLDVIFKVSDNVKVKNFEFNSAYKSYTKKYSYDAVNHTLRIIVTTGGIGSSHNLLNSKRELTLGKITFETSSKTSVEYSLYMISLMYNDNNWKSTSIPDADLDLDSKAKFTYVVKAEVPPKEDDDKEDNPGGSTGSETKPGETEDEPGTPSTPSTGNNSGATNNEGGSTSTSKTPNGNTGSTNKTDKNTSTTPNTGNVDENKEDSDDKEDNVLESDENTSNKENETDNNANNTSKSTNKTVLIISIIAIILVVGILIMVYLSLKNKKSDIDF